MPLFSKNSQNESGTGVRERAKAVPSAILHKMSGGGKALDSSKVPAPVAQKQVRKRCLVCDKSFRTRENPNRKHKRLYCSKECKKAARKK